MRPAHPAGGDADGRAGQDLGDLLEAGAVHRPGAGVAGVDGQGAGARVHGGQGLAAGVDPDDREHPQGVGPVDERLQDEGGRARVEHEQVRPVGAGLMDLVGRDDQVVDQDGHVHGAPHGVEVLQGAVGAQRLGDHRDAGRPPVLVEARQDRDVADPGQVGEVGRGALDLGDDGHGPAARAQDGGRIEGRGRGAHQLAQVLQRQAPLAGPHGGAGRLGELLEPVHRCTS